MAEDYDIGKAFQEIEKELIASMIRNLKHHRAMETEEGFEWSQWQVVQLKALEEYRKQNQQRFMPKFQEINDSIDGLISVARQQGGMEQEIKILNAIRQGYSPKRTKETVEAAGEFMRVNDKKLDSLITATKNDFTRAEFATLRMANDKYRKIIFNAQVYANAGGTTYQKAVDMATKDFLKAGINCIEYKNGARHSIRDYADMCIRTATKRAYLAGEGEKRKEWGISTVIINKRSAPCPKCLPWAGKILIDDVWSGGTAGDGPYPLMSDAIAAGLYHPRCKDIHTTYFPGVSTKPEKLSQNEKEKVVNDYNAEQKQNYYQRQAEQQERIARYSLDPENQRIHKARAVEWRRKETGILRNPVEKHKDSDIIKLSDDEKYAINYYMSSGAYTINEQIRNNVDLTVDEKKLRDNLDRALTKIPRHHGDLSRSLYFGDSEKAAEFALSFSVGETYISNEYISTTCSSELYNPEGEIQIFIRNAKKGRAIYIFNDAESEVLYERGSVFRVINIRKIAGKYHIFLEEV